MSLTHDQKVSISMKLPVIRVGKGGWTAVKGDDQKPIELYVRSDGVVVAAPREQKEEKK